MNCQFLIILQIQFISINLFIYNNRLLEAQLMIIPEFKLKQNEICIQIFIRVPYIKVSSCQFYIQSNTFKFYLKPYLLSLSFQQRLKEAQQPLKAVYYHQKYILEVHLQKENKGEFFNNLDLISNVVNKKKQKKKNSKVLVQVINSDGVVHQSSEEKVQCNQYNYGFEMNYSNIFDNLQEETIDLFGFNPKNTPLSSRYNLSKDLIKTQFDLDSYLFDKYDNQEQINCIVKDSTFATYIQQLIQRQKSVEINSQQFKLKMKIGSKQLLISHQSNIKKQIISLIFSYLYELICMNGQFGPQSARTINQTSLILYCNSFYQDESIEEMLADCYRRCMTYSLYKSLNICRYVQTNITKYLSNLYVKIIIEDLRRLFEKSQPRYLLNKIYIDDYLLYIYSMKEQNAFKELVENIDKCIVTEHDLKLGIEQYENNEEEQGSQKQEQQSLQKQQKKLIEEIEKLQTLD